MINIEQLNKKIISLKYNLIKIINIEQLIKKIISLNII